MSTDFSFDFHRTIAAGAAEAAPTTTDDNRVWDLQSIVELPSHEIPDSLLLLSVGATIDYEIGVWDVSDIPAVWRVVSTGTATNGTPVVVPFVFRGARIYIRKTNVTGADTVLFANQRQLGASVSASVLPALAATSTLQTSGNASLTSIDGKITACNTGAVTVSTLPATAATTTNQTSGNNTLTSMDTRLSMIQPATRAAAVVTSDTDPNNWTSLFIGTGGSVKVDVVGGTTVTFANVPSGTWLYVQVTRVYAIGTSATSIVGVNP
jgi:hypothetical protein